MEKWNSSILTAFLFNNFPWLQIIGVHRKSGNFHKYMEGNKCYSYFYYPEILLLTFDAYPPSWLYSSPIKYPLKWMLISKGKEG